MAAILNLSYESRRKNASFVHMSLVNIIPEFHDNRIVDVGQVASRAHHCRFKVYFFIFLHLTPKRLEIQDWCNHEICGGHQVLSNGDRKNLPSFATRWLQLIMHFLLRWATVLCLHGCHLTAIDPKKYFDKYKVGNDIRITHKKFQNCSLRFRFLKNRNVKI